MAPKLCLGAKESFLFHFLPFEELEGRKNIHDDRDNAYEPFPLNCEWHPICNEQEDASQDPN